MKIGRWKLLALLFSAVAAGISGCGPSETAFKSSAKVPSPVDHVNQPALSEIETAAVEFEKPFRIATVSGELISVESPGYASPTLADLNDDGKLDLIVGQFKDGHMSVFFNEADSDQTPEFGSRQWIQAAGKKAIVPGIS